HDRSAVEGNTLVIELAPEAQAGAAKYVAEKPAASGVYVYPTPAKGETGKNAVPAEATPVAERIAEPKPERAQPRPAATRAATLIQNVRSEIADGGALRVVVDANGAAQFKDFVLTNPWRIVVDITGVRSSVGNKVQSVGSGAVERFRVGQPSPNVVRIVVDTQSKVHYRVDRDGT